MICELCEREFNFFMSPQEYCFNCRRAVEALQRRGYEINLDEGKAAA